MSDLFLYLLLVLGYAIYTHVVPLFMLQMAFSGAFAAIGIFIVGIENALTTRGR